MISAHAAAVRAGEVSAVEYVKRVLAFCEEVNEEKHYFTVISRSLALKQARAVDALVKQGEDPGLLAGVVVSVKDNLCVKGVESTACSRILQGYEPLFSATAVQRVVDQGAIVIGKTSMDEFGFGTFNQNTGLGYPAPTHPLDSSRVTGGSSGGCAGLTAALKEFAHLSLAESTGGSIECPAAYCGVYGACPTYGLVSRNGLISYANSLDKVGVMACSAADARLGMQVISGFDAADSTSLQVTKSSQNKEVRRVGVLREALALAESGVREQTEVFLKRLEEQGCELVDVQLPVTKKFGVAAYYVLAMSEASTNLACFSGLRYGQEASKKGLSFDAYASGVRSEHLGLEAKRRVMLGTFTRMAGYRDAYYERCLQIRSQVVDEYAAVFEDVDVLVSPTMPSVAPSVSAASELSPAQEYSMDALTVGPNLAGVPHVSVPVGCSDDLPVGVLLCAPTFFDESLFSFVKEVCE